MTKGTSGQVGHTAIQSNSLSHTKSFSICKPVCVLLFSVGNLADTPSFSHEERNQIYVTAIWKGSRKTYSPLAWKAKGR
jgi:hypothetical protein